MSLSFDVMDVAYERFLVVPDKASYLHLRNMMLDAPELVRRWSHLQELQHYPGRQRYPGEPRDRAGRRRASSGGDPATEIANYWDRAAELAPAWRLCSRYHFLLARAAEIQRDDEELELERFQLSACLEGIFATGDGSEAAPFQVVHTSDIYDVLLALKQSPVGQQLILSADTRLDVIRCEDGSEWFFDCGDLQQDDEDVLHQELLFNRLSELNS
jgi:hypothetical protein